MRVCTSPSLPGQVQYAARSILSCMVTPGPHKRIWHIYLACALSARPSSSRHRHFIIELNTLNRSHLKEAHIGLSGIAGLHFNKFRLMKYSLAWYYNRILIKGRFRLVVPALGRGLSNFSKFRCRCRRLLGSDCRRLLQFLRLG